MKEQKTLYENGFPSYFFYSKQTTQNQNVFRSPRTFSVVPFFQCNIFIQSSELICMHKETLQKYGRYDTESFPGISRVFFLVVSRRQSRHVS